MSRQHSAANRRTADVLIDDEQKVAEQKVAAPKDADPKLNDRRAAWFFTLLLIVLTAAAYSRLGSCGFVSFDDPVYIYHHPRMADGLSSENIAWAFTTNYFANWHPITWLSYLLDCELFGVRPGPMHAVNLLIHIVNSVLLFWILRKLTAATASCAVVALLFALHPLHVESVAWISERKDVLSMFFLLLTIAAYQAYVLRPSWWRYFVVALMMFCGLMSKSMLVTVPPLLLVLDYWPLRRLQFVAPADRRRQTRWLVVEKLPLLGIVIAVAVVTYLAQEKGGAVGESYFDIRVSNALISYVAYLQSTFWPQGLAVFYPHPTIFSEMPTAFYQRALLSACFLIAVTAAVIVQRHKRPYLLAGWLWYLGTLVPVIGLVQVGVQSHADRYTYIPLIGIFIMLAFGLPELFERVPTRKFWLRAIASVAVVGCVATTWVQVGYWQNGVVLFQRAIAVTNKNWRTEKLLFLAYSDAGQHEMAAVAGEELLQTRPDDEEVISYMAKAHYNLGCDFDAEGRTPEAIAAYKRAIELSGGDSPTHNNLGLVYFTAGRLQEAAVEFRSAVEFNPKNAEARANLGAALCQTGHTEEGLRELQRAVDDDRNLVAAHVNYGLALSQLGRTREAGEQFKRALEIDPTNNVVETMLARSQNPPPPPN